LVRVALARLSLKGLNTRRAACSTIAHGCQPMNEPLVGRTTPALRIIAASRLRAWADRPEPPPVPVRAQPFVAPLARLGRRWWSRDELVGGRDG
jgi:hypothetical protein